VRRDGCSALDLASIACGRFDGFWEVGLHPWDAAAGVLLVREAGGTVTDFRGQAYRPSDYEILASNGYIHAEMHEAARSMHEPSAKNLVGFKCYVRRENKVCSHSPNDRCRFSSLYTPEMCGTRNALQ
jgi:hypothetical protein